MWILVYMHISCRKISSWYAESRFTCIHFTEHTEGLEFGLCIYDSITKWRWSSHIHILYILHVLYLLRYIQFYIFPDFWIAALRYLRLVKDCCCLCKQLGRERMFFPSSRELSATRHITSQRQTFTCTTQPVLQRPSLPRLYPDSR